MTDPLSLLKKIYAMMVILTLELVLLFIFLCPTLPKTIPPWISTPYFHFPWMSFNAMPLQHWTGESPLWFVRLRVREKPW